MAEEKIKFGTQLRVPIKRQLDRLTDDMGGGPGLKQQIVEAALLMFFEAPNPLQKKYVGHIRQADLEQGTAALIKQAKAKQAKRVRGLKLEED